MSLGTDPANGNADRRDFAYDAAGRVRSVLAAFDASLNLWFTLDGLDRLIGAQRASPAASTLAFAYDLSGNRTGKTLNGATTTYTVAGTSNRLTSLAGAETRSFAYDSAGNTTSAGAITYGYDNAGRRTAATVNGQSWQYAYNALGQRVRKTGGGTTTFFAYDDQGHLLGEYDATGKLIQETVWLDDLPVATLRLPAGATSGPANVFHVHADRVGYASRGSISSTVGRSTY